MKVNKNIVSPTNDFKIHVLCIAIELIFTLDDSKY